VLLANLDPMVRLGVSGVLGSDGLDVLTEEGTLGEIVARAAAFDPDAIVLGRDAAGDDLRRRVRAVAPRAKLLLLAPDESELDVFDPGRDSPRRIATAVSDALVSELNECKPPREGE
jgi:DNA-binding NarL/FixJ family response regulator